MVIHHLESLFRRTVLRLVQTWNFPSGFSVFNGNLWDKGSSELKILKIYPVSKHSWTRRAPCGRVTIWGEQANDGITWNICTSFDAAFARMFIYFFLEKPWQPARFITWFYQPTFRQAEGHFLSRSKTRFSHRAARARFPWLIPKIEPGWQLTMNFAQRAFWVQRAS
jgi:hypothetical protein